MALSKPSTDIFNEFNISQDFIEANKNFRPKTPPRKKGGPYTKPENKKRKNEVSRLHFEYGYSARKIADLMKVNRNTVNKDIEHLYGEITRDMGDSTAEFLVIKHIKRLDFQKTRLTEYLRKTKTLQEKLPIERMILDLESKIGNIQIKMCDTMKGIKFLYKYWIIGLGKTIANATKWKLVNLKPKAVRVSTDLWKPLPFCIALSHYHLLRFTHQITRIPLAVQIEKDGVRYYQTPQGNLYPSITTVLSKTSDMSALDDWRERVGNEIADKIMNESKTHGTITHQLCEDYLNNRPSERDLPNIAKIHFENLKPFLHKMDNIHGTELPLFSDEFRIAGTCDCIAEYDGILSIIDFKTSRDKLMEYYDKVQKYFVQATAYSLMWKERTGIEIDRIVIIGSQESGDVSEFIKSARDFTESLFAKLEKFRQLE